MGFSRGTLAVWATWNYSPTDEADEAVAMVGDDMNVGSTLAIK